MFVFENPSDVDTDWFLGHKNQNLGRISKKLIECISNFHLLGIQFLFENFIKKRNGAILNHDEDMNMPLQVATFLSSVKDKVSIEFPVVIICPEYYICKWNYHLNECGFESHVISSEVTGSYEAYIISFKSIKLIEHLIKLDLFCVVIDDLDSIASMRIIRKITADFNIGLTKRNFYMNPDQKLRWEMLNWISPGCVGKWNDFCRIDRLHSLAFADNYRFWWMRLTWNFCDSFERHTDEELEVYHQKVKTWGELNGMKNDFIFEKVESKRKFLNSKEHSKVKKKQKLTVSNDSLCISSSKNVSDQRSDQRNDEDINKPNPDVSKIIEDESKGESSASVIINATVFDQKLQVIGMKNVSKCRPEDGVKINLKSVSDDELDMLIKSTKNIQEDISKSDDEDPIISIINYKNQRKSEKISDTLFEIKKLSESSDSDSDFLSNFVKYKNKSVGNFRSQHISELLSNLSDHEENTIISDSEDFFTELISKKKNHN